MIQYNCDGYDYIITPLPCGIASTVGDFYLYQVIYADTQLSVINADGDSGVKSVDVRQITALEEIYHSLFVLRVNYPVFTDTMS